MVESYWPFVCGETRGHGKEFFHFPAYSVGIRLEREIRTGDS